jgi:pSer/pThr/pTyr-binding forkhead associated (FHA) protein
VVGIRVVLRFDAGTVTVGPDEQVVLGRAPSPTATARGEAVPGDASSVSKSHLLVVADGSRATIEDLGSTNGSALLRHDRPVPLEPGRPVPLADGDLVVIGALSCAVDLVLPGSDRPTTPGSVA